MERIVSNRSSGALGGWVVTDVLQLLVYPFKSHGGISTLLVGGESGGNLDSEMLLEMRRKYKF